MVQIFKENLREMGCTDHIQLAFIKKESDFNWLAKPPRENYLK